MKLPNPPTPPSNGCAEFTLKKPPPFVPSCLIAIWPATGPRAIVWPNPWMPRRRDRGPEGLDDALRHEQHGHDRREREQDVDGPADEVAPEVAELVASWSATNPRNSATSTAMPTAADTKFWNVSASIWLR